ncbi:MAG: hypothetical protein K2N80_06905 [Lachnospiraceae bacterium]|nr:hypothetical protein [Lachnospiraceae bacterium]
MKNNMHKSDDSRQFLFRFLYGDGLKIDPSLNAEERKKYVRERIKKIWIYNGFLFLLVIFFSEIQDNFSQNQSYYMILLIFIASIFIVLGLIDCIKLLIRNRKIDKMQASMNVIQDNDVDSRNHNNKYIINQTDTDITNPAVQTGQAKNNDKAEASNTSNDNQPTAAGHFEQAFYRQLGEARGQDPLIGAKTGAEDIWNMLIKAFTEPDGRINAKAVLLWSSGLAGFVCQVSAWEKARLDGKSPELFSVQTKDGKNFYMGESINRPLLSDQNSIWNLAAGICQKLEPSRPLPDIQELVKQSVDMIGNENYKMWNEINPEQMVKEYRDFWKLIKNKVTGYCKSPEEWPLLFGLVLQKALQMTVKVTPPEQNCLEMAMENALFTSKMDIIEELRK